MTLGLAGRATAAAGIVCGLLGIALHVTSHGGRYVEDGTAVAFLLTLLALASHFPAETGRDAVGAAQGAAAFGFFLFVPARYAFDDLGTLGAGAWLGLCSGLIPLGFGLLRMHERAPADPAPARAPAKPAAPQLAAASAGLLLIVVGVWLDVFSGGGSYWDVSHTLALLMLVLVVLNALLLLGIWTSPDSALIVAAATFGLVEFAWVTAAFEDLGDLAAGAWIEAFGGLFLLAGVVLARRAAVALPTASPAPAQ